jgi:hypothetical protein
MFFPLLGELGNVFLSPWPLRRELLAIHLSVGEQLAVRRGRVSGEPAIRVHTLGVHAI